MCSCMEIGAFCKMIIKFYKKNDLGSPKHKIFYRSFLKQSLLHFLAFLENGFLIQQQQQQQQQHQ